MRASRTLSLLNAVAARRPSTSRRQANIGGAERAGSALTGAALLMWGLSRRSLGGTLAGMAGGALIYRGARGRSRLYEAVGMSTAAPVGAVERVVTINRSPDEVWAFCHDLHNLPRFMPQIVSVNRTESGQLAWLAAMPGTVVRAWEAEIEADTPGEIFRWRAADAPSGGFGLRLAPGGRGTEVRLTLDHTSAWEVDEMLRRLKQIVEAGELPTTEGQPAGRAG